MKTGLPSDRIKYKREMKQRLDYLHENPVRSGLVGELQHFKYSSDIHYYSISFT